MSIVETPTTTPTRFRTEFRSGVTAPEALDATGAVDGSLPKIDDGAGEQLFVYLDDDLVATVGFAPTASTDFAVRASVAAERLAGTFVLNRPAVRAAEPDEGILALTLFLAMRRQRIAGQTHYLTIAEPGSSVDQLLRPSKIAGASPFSSGNAVSGRIDEATLRCFESMDESLRDVVRGDGFVEEVHAAVMAGVARFVANPFFAAARAGTLTQSQYVHSVANNHQFVRYTTRMLGLAVSTCEDPELRKHFAHHLSGEVNHEIWLEEDLAYLDADVDYVKDLMVPDAPIANFNYIQESLTSFRRDPVVFMGVPIAIEGASAFMPLEAIEAIRDCIRTWGYDKPKLGTRFLASHIHTDGGHGDQDGHWAGTLRTMKDHVKSERQQQQILRIVELVFDALNSAYEGYVAGPAV